MSYQLEGDLLEVCTCQILCPCWVGEKPDGDGTCQSINSWHVRKGQINGVDVSNLTIAGVNNIPGNPLDGNWKVIFFVDDKATPQQHDALVGAFTGKLGGPIKGIAESVRPDTRCRQGADFVRRQRGQRSSEDRRRPRSRDGAVQRRNRSRHQATGHRLFDHTGLPCLRRQSIALSRERTASGVQYRPPRAQRHSGALSLRRVGSCQRRLMILSNGRGNASAFQPWRALQALSPG